MEKDFNVGNVVAYIGGNGNKVDNNYIPIKIGKIIQTYKEKLLIEFDYGERKVLRKSSVIPINNEKENKNAIKI